MGLALFVLAFVSALVDWAALTQGWKKTEYFAKPAVMIFLFAWLAAATKLEGALLWFGLGILLSLIGDLILLWWPDRGFLPGLFAFLLAHIAYIIGFSSEAVSPDFWDIILAVILMVSGVRILWRLVSALKSKGMNQLVTPVWIYGAAISIMLFFAMRTLTRPLWNAGASLLVSTGAFLFYISDVILAWNRFINPIRNGRLFNMAAYHLGQMALIVGVAVQFG